MNVFIEVTGKIRRHSNEIEKDTRSEENLEHFDFFETINRKNSTNSAKMVEWEKNSHHRPTSCRKEQLLS
jgi:hypothetical protein